MSSCHRKAECRPWWWIWSHPSWKSCAYRKTATLNTWFGWRVLWTFSLLSKSLSKIITNEDEWLCGNKWSRERGLRWWGFSHSLTYVLNLWQRWFHLYDHPLYVNYFDRSLNNQMNHCFNAPFVRRLLINFQAEMKLSHCKRQFLIICQTWN